MSAGQGDLLVAHALTLDEEYTQVGLLQLHALLLILPAAALWVAADWLQHR
jgi:hypothetical protein